MDYSTYQHLLFERRENGVLLITINRPEVYNATNGERDHGFLPSSDHKNSPGG